MSSNLTAYNSEKDNKKGKPTFRLKADRFIFFICILIAAIFWLLIKLSDVYTVENAFELTYNNEPSGMRVTKLVDSTLKMNLTARGFLILKLNLFTDMEKLDIDLSNYTIETKGDKKYAIYTQELTKKLAEIVGTNENSITFSKAMVSFNMEKSSEKLIPIIPNYSIQFVSQYDLYQSVITTPSSVLVYGPQSILDKLKSISTNKLILENIMSNQVIKVNLENSNPDLLRLEINEVSLDFKVEKFTESEILIPINNSGLQYEIKTFPSQVKVYYRVAQIDFNKVRSHQFNIFPVLNNLDILQVNKLPLELSKQPNFVRNIRIVPSYVEFLIIK